MAEDLDPREIFLRAFSITDSSKLAQFLDHACAGNSATRAKVESMLRGHFQNKQLQDTFLPVDDSTFHATIQQPSAADIGDQGSDASRIGSWGSCLTPSTRRDG